MSATPEAVEIVAQVLGEYGQALRGDWSDFDGRGTGADLGGLAAELRGDGEPSTLAEHRAILGLCPDGNGHWRGRWGHCRADTCPTFRAEEAAN